MQEKVFISIYCKIFTDTFSDEMFCAMATGDEIFEFLMKDGGHCFDNKGNIIPGDSNIWYLGCNEKFGWLIYEKNVSSWGFGESSFERVRVFVDVMHRDGLFDEEQYHNLIKRIKEGCRIDNMYAIGDYLINKREGKRWFNRKTYFRDRIKSMILKTVDALEGTGFRVYHPSRRKHET